MKLTVLGNNGPYPAIGGATSGYLLNIKDKVCLLDCGSGVFSNLIKHVLPENLSAIFISHLHFDHISDLGVLSYYLSTRPNKTKIKLYLPDTNPYIEQIIASNMFEVTFYKEGQVDFDLKITATQVVHPVKSFALTFYDDKVFTYTGDTNFCPQVEDLFKISNTVLCDACFLQDNWSQNKPHMSIKGVCEIAKKYSKRVILSHLNPQTSLQEYEQEAFGDYILTYVNQEISL